MANIRNLAEAMLREVWARTPTLILNIFLKTSLMSTLTKILTILQLVQYKKTNKKLFGPGRGMIKIFCYHVET